MQETLEKLVLPEILPASDEAVVAYLRHSYKFAEMAALAERDTLILAVCQQLGISISDEELQAAGDAFRLEHKLLGASETLAWLGKQRISPEDWSQGIRVSLLTQKLKEHLFGEVVDNHYMTNRDDYRRVALSQILVRDLTEALKIAQSLRVENASFCALALEHSKGKRSQQNAGFVGIRFLAELLPEIAKAVAEAKEGEVVGPIQTKLGYHILRIEKRFSAELGEVREQVLESLFQTWLNARSNSDIGDEMR
ncbi:peptidylprolyl isomerase [Microcoleus sp. Pol14C2]|uniref:peptidylprolyl isomerase n=1 Tax=Microcoleaceae TaxID=1892252 RepID=UPI0018801E28|nr:MULTISPECIES: peptidylprolyl isomerase [unclassified Tychonema]MBE9119508.1 peptidylprolyl isomerase [Tychonema sp. LEGE 07199]MBE9130720.1 peptidylprolyl isomerase [Tychonema sp. LEGE 07196]